MAALRDARRAATVVFGDDLRPAAVLDWEIATLGDPLADVGTLMAYWPEAGEQQLRLGEPANLAPGFPSREQLAARVAAGLHGGRAPLRFVSPFQSFPAFRSSSSPLVAATTIGSFSAPMAGE